MGLPDPDEVEENGMTVDDITDEYLTADDDGATEVVVPPEWEDDDEEPVFDAWDLVENDAGRHLELWYRGVEIVIWNERFLHWGVSFDFSGAKIDADVGGILHGGGRRPHTVKSMFSIGVGDEPEGYVDEVDFDGSGPDVLVKTATNFQPTTVARVFVDDVLSYVEDLQEWSEKAEETFSAAAENE